MDRLSPKNDVPEIFEDAARKRIVVVDVKQPLAEMHVILERSLENLRPCHCELRAASRADTGRRFHLGKDGLENIWQKPTWGTRLRRN